MYSVYISEYLENGVYVKEPRILYENRSPAGDMFVIDPVVDLEDSKAGSFTFSLPLNHYAYDMLEKKRTLVTIVRDEYTTKKKVIFEGVVTSADRDLYKTKKVYCEGFPTFLNDTCQPRMEYLNISLKEYFEALITNHNSRYTTRDRKFKVVWDDNNLPKFPEDEVVDKTIREQLKDKDLESGNSLYEATQYESTFYYLQDLRNRCKGHFIFSIDPDETSTEKYIIQYVKDIPQATEDAQEIRFGMNLLDYTDSFDFSNLCTSVLPVASLGNYNATKIGDVVGIVPNEDLVFGEVGYILDPNKLSYNDVVNGDYVYALNTWPQDDQFFATGGAHHLYLVVDREKLNTEAEDYDPDKRIEAFRLLSSTCMVLWDTQLGYPEGQDSAAVSIPLHSSGRYAAVYKNYACFPSVGTNGIYYIDRSNGAVYTGNGIVPEGQDKYTQVTGQDASFIWDNRSYHVVKYFIPYYVYRGDVETKADLPENPNPNDAYYVYGQAQEGYYAYNAIDSAWQEIDAIDKSVIGAETPGVERLYVSTRGGEFFKSGYVVDYLWSISYPGLELDRYEMSPSSQTLGWDSISDKEFPISANAGETAYLKAALLNVSGWGGSLRTTIKKGTYTYKTPDYSIGDIIETSAYHSYLDGNDNTEVTWPNGVYDNALAYYRYGHWKDEQETVWLNEGNCLNPISAGHAQHYNVEGKKAVYITARLAQAYNPTGGHVLFWYVSDSADQMLYYEDFSDKVTVNNYKIDLTTDKLAGACHLVINSWGNVDTEVRDYVPQIGGLTDYMTVEGAEDYYYYSYEHHIDRMKMHEKGSLYVESNELIDIYGRIERKVEFKNVGDPNVLVRKAVNYLVNTQYDDLQLTLTGVDLHNLDLDIDAFDISTKIPVYSAPHGVDKQMPVTSLRIALNNPRDNELVLGETKTLSERMEEGANND